jgi:NodT family efflux transporter outer membrane factor (OMF) lipoprotein
MRRLLSLSSSLSAFALALSLHPSSTHAAPPDSAASPYRGEDLPRYRNVEGPAAPLANASWWERFGDPRLNALVEKAMDDSYDIATAESRIDEAEAVITQNLSPLLPTVTWDSSVNMAPLDSLGFQFGGAAGGGMMMGDLPELYYTASSVLKFGVEVDLTGRNVLAYEASKREARASQHELEQQSVVLTASIVSAYYDVVTAKAQLEIVHEQVATNESLLELIELRFEHGQANAVDVLQQRQQVASSKTLLPQATTQLRTFEQQLAVLVGDAPGEQHTVAESLPALGPPPAVGSPSDLQSSRPDLRAAADRLEAAEKREKQARRQFAPSLRLNAQAGAQGIYIQDWNTQWFWGAGATLSVPLYNGQRIYGQLKQSKAQTRTASNQLSATTLVAIREVEDALVREQQQRDVVAAQVATAEAAHAAFDESRKRYEEGLSEYLPVLTALNALQQAQLNVITAQRDLIAARIQLHRALGDQGATVGS